MSLTSIIIKPPLCDALTYWGMIALVVIVGTIFLKFCFRAAPNKKEVITLTAFILLTIPVVLAGTGILRVLDTTPPPSMLLPPYILGISALIGFSKFGKSLSTSNSIIAFACLSAFRFPLEMLMHHAADVGIMTQLFSYSGYNYDIITGILATIILILVLMKKTPPRALIWTWNIVGILCLVAIFALAIMSSPVVHAFGESPDVLNTWVLYFPYVWLPTFLVIIAMLSHICVTRALLSKKS